MYRYFFLADALLPLESTVTVREEDSEVGNFLFLVRYEE
jgi:hypothetical protein